MSIDNLESRTTYHRFKNFGSSIKRQSYIYIKGVGQRSRNEAFYLVALLLGAYMPTTTTTVYTSNKSKTRLCKSVHGEEKIIYLASYSGVQSWVRYPSLHTYC